MWWIIAIAILLISIGSTIYLFRRTLYKHQIEKKSEIDRMFQEAESELKNAREAKEEILRRAKEDAHEIDIRAEKIINQANEYDNKITGGAEEKLKSIKSETEDLIRRKVSFLNEIKEISKQAYNANRELDNIKRQIENANNELLVSESTVYFDNNISSEEYKDKLALLDLEYREFIKSGRAVDILNSEGYNNKKRFNDNVKQILRCFDSEAKMIISSVTAFNIDKMRGQLTKAFQTINNIFATDFIALNKQVLEMQLKQLNLIYSYQQKKAQEQEEQKAIKAQMIEEEKVRREIEREKAKVEKEEIQFKNEINKLMKYLAKASEIEKQLYIDKIKELEDKVRLLEKDKENILQREQNTRAGYVYIISNIGSFGENIYKIGMTRRLEPMDRVKELGDASVPFEFDVHAMIFSEDAPALETILHNTFKENQVNLVNPRKEFYNVSLVEIEKVVKENYNATVTFTHIAEAVQYRESLRIRSAT